MSRESNSRCCWMPERTLKRFPVCSVTEIPPGSRRLIEIGGRSIGVFNVNNEFFAVRNRCPHQGGPLCIGHTTGLTRAKLEPGRVPDIVWERDGEILRCPWHAWEFDLRSGEAVFGQGIRVATYRAYLEEGKTPPELPPGATIPPPLEMYKTVIEERTVVVELAV